MVDVVFAIPGDLSAPTGGYAYDRRLLGLLPAQGILARHLALPAGYPHPSESDLAATARLVGETAPHALLLVDGLAYGAMPEALIEGFRRRIVALVHHPLSLESGLAPERQAALLASESRALALAEQVIVTSKATARLLRSEFAVPAHRISVAEPGTEPAPRARGTGSPVELLSVGAVSPRKGYELLAASLGSLADLAWHLTIAGSADRDPEAAAGLRQTIARLALTDRVTLAGAVSDEGLAALLAGADLFVSASLFEGYGMGLAEAMARGLPLVLSNGGAAGDTVPDAAALKVPPGDGPALTAALRRAITEPALRARLAEASFAAGERLPRWSDTAASVARILREAWR